MDGIEALHNNEIWNLLSDAQRENSIEEEQETQSIAEINVKPQKNALLVVKKNILQAIMRFFHRNPKLPLQVGELNKININWLAQYIPQEMIEDIERKRLKAENKNPKKQYVPNAKIVFYAIMDSLEKEGKGILWDSGSKTFKTSNGKFRYINVEGNERVQKYTGNSITETEVSIKIGKFKFVKNFFEPDIDSYQIYLVYLDFLDNIFNTNFRQELLQELEDRIISMNELKKSDFFKKIEKSFYKLYRQYKNTREDFMAKENYEREQFYGKHKGRTIEKKLDDNPVQSFRKSIAVAQQVLDISERKHRKNTSVQGKEKKKRKDENKEYDD